MSLSEYYIKAARWLLPMPFTIAIFLSLITFIAALSIQQGELIDASWELLKLWEEGLWNKPLMAFALQMMLMLVLGHVLASTNVFQTLISKVTVYCTSTSKAALIISFSSLIMSLLNWGLGLIFSAILCRKVGEYFKDKGQQVNYSILGASAYVGLMVWHGGLSGSAPLKIAEKGHFFEQDIGLIYLNRTIFSSMNLTSIFLLLILIPLLAFFLGKTSKKTILPNWPLDNQKNHEKVEMVLGAERIDRSRYIGKFIGLSLLLYLFFKVVKFPSVFNLGFLTPNFINLLLLALGLFLHESLETYVTKVENAIGSAAGILLQFPLYFGIMSLISNSGLLDELASFFIQISDQSSFPIFTLISAGIINVFVPSGGGQWAVQGPIVIEAAKALNVSISKSVMALAYGDQLTNMLQPFWALPLLGITGLKAKDILPYSFLFMLVGVLIFIFVLILF